MRPSPERSSSQREGHDPFLWAAEDLRAAPVTGAFPGDVEMRDFRVLRVAVVPVAVVADEVDGRHQLTFGPDARPTAWFAPPQVFGGARGRIPPATWAGNDVHRRAVAVGFVSRLTSGGDPQAVVLEEPHRIGPDPRIDLRRRPAFGHQPLRQSLE